MANPYRNVSRATLARFIANTESAIARARMDVARNEDRVQRGDGGVEHLAAAQRTLIRALDRYANLMHEAERRGEA